MLTIYTDNTKTISKELEKYSAVPYGAFCTHPRMQECHRGCKHFSCPDCELDWDDASWEDPSYLAYRRSIKN